jgi:serine/threonine protein kinase
MKSDSKIMEPGSETSIDGNQIEILERLGEGTQGVVYKVKVEERTYAMKWYHESHADEGQRDRLKDLADRGAPSERFIWPKLFLEEEDRFGYLMDLCPPDFISVGELLGTRVDTTFRALVRACLQLVTEFRSLHSAGLCYGDISYNNVFLKPETGEIRIIDNDNVVVNESGEAGVLGTPRFMAPEVVRSDAVPSKETDDFSLAVLIYYILLFEHPLHGEREYKIHAMDEPAMEQLYGEDPVFMFDPDDSSNRPVKGHHDTVMKFWEIYPSYLKRAFVQTFTEGLTDPSARTSNRKWQDVLLRLHDNILYCPHCGISNFYDLEHIRSNSGQIGTCWHDDEDLVVPPRMKFDGENRVLMLNHDSQIFDFHVDPSLNAQQHRFRFDNPVLEVSQHPSKDLWGLKNLSDKGWRIHKADGTTESVPSGKTVALSSGLKIDFGRRSAVIRD